MLYNVLSKNKTSWREIILDKMARLVCGIGPGNVVYPLSVDALGGIVMSGKAPTAQGGFHLAAASTNGTELLSGRPANTSGVRIEIPSSGSATYYFTTSGSTPGSAPTYYKTVTGPATVDEPLAPGDGIFFTALIGTVIARFIQR